MGATAPFEVDLGRTSDTPSQARKLLTDRFGAELTGAEMDTAKLLTSELVTNAVVHGQGRIGVRGHLDQNRLLVEVIDEGSGFERLADQREFRGFGGWGLNLVDAESSRWGIHEGTTHVWFELERQGPRLGLDAKPDT